MENLKFQIPYYKEINEFFQSIPSEFGTIDPNLFCLRMIENEGPTNNYKPPFRKDFYFTGLVSNAGTTKITYDNVNVTMHISDRCIRKSSDVVSKHLRYNAEL